MKNFLKETLMAIEKAGKTPYEIRWVFDQRTGASSLWSEFADLSNFEYDSGFGQVEINRHLAIEFSDGSFLIREDYDGAENWRLIGWPRFTVEDAQLRLREV